MPQEFLFYYQRDPAQDRLPTGAGYSIAPYLSSSSAFTHFKENELPSPRERQIDKADV
jgi:hypothetical protein